LPTIIERAADAIIQLEGPYSINLAGLYTHSGDFVKALRIFDQLQAEDGPRPDIHIGRAKVLWAMGEDDQALAELDRAIALNPRAALAYHYRGAIYLQQGHLDEATKNTEAALFLAPTSATYYQSGQIAQAQGDIHLALQHYETAIKKATPFFFTRYATEVAGRPPLAEERLPCLVVPRLADDLVLPSLAMGTLLENAGDYPQAVEVYQRGLSYLPDEPRLKARLDRLCGEQPASCQEWRFEPE
jgi:tetratricopeptide (TPR) repeat protein